MRLLVIEDEPKIARGLKNGLEQESFAVDVESTYEDGLATAQSFDYDLIILDRMLPGGDGADLAQILREAEVHIPILMLTARDSIADKVEGLNVGADDYLLKPFDFDELLARINALLRRPKQTLQSVLECGAVQLHVGENKVTVAGSSIALSGKEFAVLEYIVRASGRTVSKDQIIEHVWDFDADILPNTVEAVVKSIRSKIDKPYGVTTINTVRGVGYQANCEESNV